MKQSFAGKQNTEMAESREQNQLIKVKDRHPSVIPEIEINSGRDSHEALGTVGATSA